MLMGMAMPTDPQEREPALRDEAPLPLGTLAASAYNLLAAGRHPLASEALIEHVFNVKARMPAPSAQRQRFHSGARPEPQGGYRQGSGGGDFWRGQLAKVLGNAAVFTQYGDGTWGLTAWGSEDVALEAMEYVVVDCETTGLDPNTQRVIEIGALRCRGPRVLDRFTTLINPERSIPQAIRQLTGITPAMLYDAPLAPEAIAGFLDFAGGSLLIGHNVRFDYNFLGAEAQRHQGVRLLNPSLCTIRLASKLLPSLRQRNLGSLAAALEIPIHDRHRAMGDAEVTQRVFWRLAERARDQKGIATLGRLHALVGPSSGSVKAVDAVDGARRTGKLLLSPTLRQGLPERPGVYLMKDATGSVIYVGKAKNIKKRIASYYSHPLNYRRKMDGLLENVADLETRVVGSELEALILESQLIKAFLPQYNVQLKYYRHYPFIKVDVASPFPRVYAVREVLDDGARYFGPYRSKRAVDTLVDLAHRMFKIRSCTRTIAPDGSHRGRHTPCLGFLLKTCLGPCMGGVTAAAYHKEIDKVLDFLSNGRDTMLEALDAKMRQAADELRFEEAAKLRDALSQARRVLVSQQLLNGAVERHNLVIVCPGVGGGAELFGIRHGRLFEQCSLPEPGATEARDVVWAFLARLDRAAAAPPLIGQEEVDAIIIINSWLARRGDSPQVVRLPEAIDAATVDAVIHRARVVHRLEEEAASGEYEEAGRDEG